MKIYDGEEKRIHSQKISYLNNDDNYPIKTIINDSIKIEIPSFIKKQYFITNNEYKLYSALEEIYKNTDYKISTQVALNQIIAINERRNDINNEFNSKISKKSIDFVIFNLKLKSIYLCIELNDKTHELERRQKRDAYLKEIFKQVEIPLLFIESKNYYNQEEIKKVIKEVAN